MRAGGARRDQSERGQVKRTTACMRETVDVEACARFDTSDSLVSKV
ncbi:hypothetical protein I6A84_29660 [Frankia sp. CNm7]|uniref:Uncharacterized protein n=1 Tax=Frankia nepalensis TaxID=1836974 RepID=A0A937RLF4_9ACTN|nr:hypothetical protein [Frankia nepalensis]MBL7502819.1 hypothetical protein [Frankia nepalensis]MBL7515274.1 hypothetical protein [Frankia nepalensis]MBL7522132.1 hypothetical protein [Frankia nepalensis]MBL7632287.1 hypothetical protein [Frankia nepalensis]